MKMLVNSTNCRLIARFDDTVTEFTGTPLKGFAAYLIFRNSLVRRFIPRACVEVDATADVGEALKLLDERRRRKGVISWRELFKLGLLGSPSPRNVIERLRGQPRTAGEPHMAVEGEITGRALFIKSGEAFSLDVDDENGMRYRFFSTPSKAYVSYMLLSNSVVCGWVRKKGLKLLASEEAFEAVRILSRFGKLLTLRRLYEWRAFSTPSPSSVINAIALETVVRA